MRVTATALGAIAALLALPACSTADNNPALPAIRAGSQSDGAHKTAVLSSAALESRLLDQNDLGNGYLPEPDRPTLHDDVSVLGCPALSKLGGDAATGGTLTFPRRAKAGFT
ncbi:hypothetical protein [Streptomyces sp. NPDC092952]|uniref:hypothetical protein n=1 Tax=Streptomyces sp. NPDC092952 TaxID=3366018 RepID=UPI00380419D6